MTPFSNTAFAPSEVAPQAFAARRALMPMWGQNELPAAERDARWKTVVAQPIAAGALAYVHIPFCANHCVFCGFYRNGWKAEVGQGYVDRLVAEIAMEASGRAPGGRIDAVYLGGGTPTILAAEDLARLIRALREHLPLAPDCEITVEGRISHFDRAKVDACLAAGANRFSIGIQTFNSSIRRRLGRKHEGEAAAAYLAELARHSQAVVVADLIFGLPGQDMAVWQKDLDTALSLGLSGLDVYAFNLFPGLPINRMIEKGAFPAAPGLAEQARQYALAVRVLAAAGWEQISNSHFAAPGGLERNRYNLAIKAGAECLAFGSGAGGQRAGFSYAVESDLETYLATPAAKKPLARLAALPPEHATVARLQGEIEAGGFGLKDLPAAALALVEPWRAAQLIELEPGRARLTTAGRFWGPTLTRVLADAITRGQPLAAAA
ncbi:MAG: heme anaerobic degradation radical SAM methyltransferase ChuW/HutW [Burkholderiaceae bacterium]